MKKHIPNEQILRSVEINMKTEGFAVSERAKKDSLALLAGKTTADKIVKNYLKQYKHD